MTKAKPENKTKYIDQAYYLLSSSGDESVAYFYYNADAGIYGFGFNISDGGGFLSHDDITKQTEIKLITMKYQPV